MRLTVSKKINLGFLMMALLIAMASAVGYYGAVRLSNSLHFIMTQAWNAADGAMEGTIGIQKQMIEMHNIISSGAADEGGASARKSLAEANAFADEALGRMRSSGLIAKAEIQALDARLKSYHAMQDALLSAHDGRAKGTVSPEQFARAKAAFEKESENLLTFVGELEEIGDGKVEGEAGNVAATTRFVFSAITAVTVVALALAAAAAFLSSRMIARPIALAAHRLGEIAQGDGDLKVSLDVKGHDEIADLARGFNGFAAKIRDTITRVADAAAGLGSSGDQMSRIADETNRAIGQQRSETEQLATAMNEMASTVQEVARNAAEASAAAHEADKTAEKGRQVVAQVSASIRDLAGEVKVAAEVIHTLESESENIGSVLDVIKGIAEQTNLLALNAAIEAARAGEQGRGFAVVADEVRTLASRTQQSTHEIQEMIERLQSGAKDAVQAMDQGQGKARENVALAEQAGESLNEIARAVSTINDMNTQIASAAEEQGAVAEEINRNVVAVNDISNQTAQGAEQSAAASEELARLASELQGLVRHFRN